MVSPSLWFVEIFDVLTAKSPGLQSWDQSSREALLWRF